LRLEEGGIEAAALQQLNVRAALYQLAASHYSYLVRIHDSREAVGDDQGRPPLHQAVKCLQ
jgi:hypothetical protein